jgi:hypothetical protein
MRAQVDAHYRASSFGFEGSAILLYLYNGIDRSGEPALKGFQ